MRIKSILIAWDFLLSSCISVAAFFFLPSKIPIDTTKDIYSIGISVLAIVFSVYFAAIAIIMSSSDNEFIEFLEEVGDYTLLIKTFRYGLITLFVSLIWSIIIYSLTSLWISGKYINQPNYVMASYLFLFFYGLFVAAASTNDAIQYSNMRARYVKIRSKQKAQEPSLKIDKAEIVLTGKVVEIRESEFILETENRYRILVAHDKGLVVNLEEQISVQGCYEPRRSSYPLFMGLRVQKLLPPPKDQGPWWRFWRR